jgi:hypothetical protein
MMMKRNNDQPYHTIISFEDFRLEKERLIFKSKLIETKIELYILLICKAFSVSNLVLSSTRELVLPEIFDFVKEIFIKRSKM